MIFIYPPGRLSRLEAARAARAPTELFFGGIEAEKNVIVEHIEVALDGAKPIRPGQYKHLLHRTLLLWRTVLKARRLTQTLSGAEGIVIVEERLALAMSFWNIVCRRRLPLVCIRCHLSRMAGSSRIAQPLLRLLLRRTYSVMLGQAEAPIARERYSLGPEHMSFETFGVDETYWTPGHGKGKYVLCVGDSGRDYTTLLRAAEKISAPIRIVSGQQFCMPLPSNVTVQAGSFHKQLVSDADLRELYRHAACVVITLRDSPAPRGQSVCLQAMSSGIPVIMTRTSGFFSTELKDGENIIFVEVNDVTGLAQQVNRITGDTLLASRLGAAGRALVCKHFRIADFSRRLQAICKMVSGKSETPLRLTGNGRPTKV